ncbi:DapH/DapD/GlmU-related protein [Vibrio breoganii]|uniref:DapH/DapD/GlmU-related protein n=1 Tax=Vibrio breoganii TaxID=553239 RepID=UPI0021C46FB0|nr:DapH/DapD/GlmU-related protein [Vibrio breoganii]MDN3715925.1 DapH/DapD/GlmU-related protein [Vibrio breoganii]
MHKLKNSVSLKWLSEQLGAPFVGSAEYAIDNIADLELANQNSLTFSRGVHHKNNNSVVIASVISESTNVIISENPRLTFVKALDLLNKTTEFDLDSSAPSIHDTVTVGQNVTIENGVVIGEGTVIEHNVVIMRGTTIGKNCFIRSGSVIGGDGFGFERLEDGVPIRFMHLAGVTIGNNVEVGASTCIAKGVLRNTTIEDNVKIDNLVHISHNCHVKKGTYIIASAILCGGVIVGENCWIAPGANIKEKVQIGNNAQVGIGAVVIKDILDGDSVFGNPSRSLKKFKKS